MNPVTANKETGTMPAHKLIEAVGKIVNCRGFDHIEAHALRVASAVTQLSTSQPTLEFHQVLKSALRADGFSRCSTLPGFDLNRLISNHTGNCVELVFLSMLVCRILSWPAWAVRVPQHIFLRVATANGQANVEPTQNGPCLDDDAYAVAYGVTERERLSGVSLTNLTDEQLLVEILHKNTHDPLVAGAPLLRGHIEHIRAALNVHPHCIDFYNSMGLNYLTRNKPTVAIRWFRRGLEMDPESLPLINNLVETYVELGRYDSAVQWAEKHPQHPLSPLGDDHSLRQNLIRCYCRLGDDDRARQLIQSLFADCDRAGSSDRRVPILPYLSLLEHLSGQYELAANHAIEWACSDRNAEVGWLWARIALRRREIQHVEFPQTFRDPLVDHLMRCFGRPNRIHAVSKFCPERKGEVACYLGEIIGSQSPELATHYWKKTLRWAKRNTFEYLRALRLLEKFERTRVRAS